MEAYKIFICIALISTYDTAASLNNYEKHQIGSDSAYRLPDTIVPINYDISLTIDPEKSEYDGNVFLYFDLAENVGTVNEIYLHADLDFLDITQILLNNVTNCNIGTINEANILPIDCATEIAGHNNVLNVIFTGDFSTEDGFGLVKTSYLEKGTEQILIESNFKPIYARRAFPCLDEPVFKASFSLKITYPEEYNVISNTPVKSESSRDGLKVTEFEKTPKISPYLFSIFFSKLGEASSSPGDAYEVKVYTRPEVANMTNTIASVYSSKIIEQLSNYTGVYNNLMDSESYLVAVPNYFSDTMGGFGLFTSSESELLDEGDKTSARVKQNIIADISYKLSHEWYGGDVSTKWWSDIWANEAVATYFKYIIPDQIEEELELRNQFMVEVIQKALQHDALPLAQPLSSDVNLSRDIENKLDSFSYLKGASILHMTKYVVRGAENLKAGLQYHWTQRQEFGTDGEDLLRDLVTLQSNEEYYPLLETWALSPGFPLLSVKLSDSNDRTETTSITQKRFVYPIDNSPNYDNDKWAIPLTTTSQREKNFDKSMDAFYRPGQDASYVGVSNIWLLFNLQGGSFYRVNYEDQLWRRFINYLKSDERAELEVLSRSRLVDDIFNIARIGDVSYALAFELADYLVGETEYYPWYSALNAFSYIIGKLEDDEVEAKLKKYILDLMDNEVYIPSNILAKADDSAHIEILKRVMVLNWACDLGHAGCIEYATNKFKTFKEDPTSLEDYNYRSLIFCNGIRHSDNIEADWAFLWDVFSNSPSVHEKTDILDGLGCAEDKDILISYLQKLANTGSGINKHDALTVFKSVFSSSLGLDAAMEFLQDRSENIFNGVDVLSEVLYTISEKLFTDEHLEWIKDVLTNTVLDDYEDVKSKAIVMVSVNNYWKNYYQKEVKNVLIAPSTPSTITTTRATTTRTTITTQSTTGTASTTEPSTTTESSCGKTSLSKFIGALILLVLTIL